MTARSGLGLGVRARARLGAITLVARLNLVWERFWPRLIPLLAIVAAFVAVALLDLLPQLPFWLHALAGAFSAYAGHAFEIARRRAVARYGTSRPQGFEDRGAAAFDHRNRCWWQ